MTAPETLVAALAGRYELISELGSGGMATVYLADDLRHNRQVAIKVLHPEFSALVGSSRFRREIETTARLQHPNILPLFDSGDAGAQLFYVMPFVNGGTLRQRLSREQQLPVDEAVRIAREVADALAYAHEHGIVHRDIKPENILLGGRHAMVADFGIALALEQASGSRLTSTGLSIGTPLYMSPEQAMGDRVIDARADIYALGAIVYEMLAGEPPFTGPNAQAILARSMTETPRSLGAGRTTVPESVDSAVRRALASRPADRFQTAGDFAAALGGTGTFRTADPSSASTDPRVHVATRRSTMLRLGVAAVALVGVGAGIGALTRGGLASQTPAAGAGAEPRFLAIPLPDSAPFVAGRNFIGNWVRSLAVAPDGRRIVYSSASGAASSLWEVRLDQGTATSIAGTTGAILPTLSPDGSTLAFLVGRDLRKIDRDNGRVVSVATVETSSLSWPTSQQLLVFNALGCQRVSPVDGSITPIPGQECGVSVGTGAGAHGTVVVTGRGLLLIDEDGRRTRAVQRGETSDTSGAYGRALGHTAFMIGDSTIVWVRLGTLTAARVDARTARLTTEPRVIVSGMRDDAFQEGGNFAYTRSGDFVWVAVNRELASRFVVVNRAGRVVKTLPLAPARILSFALSPDGHRLAFISAPDESHSSTVIADLQRDDADSSASLPNLGLLVPLRWLPDGRGFSANYFARTPASVRFVIVSSRSGTLAIDSVGTPYMNESPDGAWRCDRGRLWPVAHPVDTTRFDAQSTWCTFSPDSRAVAWVSAAGALFVAPAGASARTERRMVAAFGDEPLWSRDGRELLYRAADVWYAVPISAAAPTAPPTRLFSGRFEFPVASWALTPEGNFLVLQGPPPRSITHINVITNFPRFVEERLRAPVR
ncbi:MAG: serine/threonine-protein kinase [Gemmatimonadaceae bacterium]|nr:serine/threonine-protein kinase [Gemmatimonadaceae bacterium]